MYKSFMPSCKFGNYNTSRFFLLCVKNMCVSVPACWLLHVCVYAQQGSEIQSKVVTWHTSGEALKTPGENSLNVILGSFPSGDLETWPQQRCCGEKTMSCLRNSKEIMIGIEFDYEHWQWRTRMISLFVILSRPNYLFMLLVTKQQTK